MKRCEAKEKERETAQLMRQHKELAVQGEQCSTGKDISAQSTKHPRRNIEQQIYNSG